MIGCEEHFVNIFMKMTVQKANWNELKTDVLVRSTTDKRIGEVIVEPAPMGGRAKFLVTIGLGNESMTRENIREATGTALAQAKSLRASSVAIELLGLGDELSTADCAQAAAEAVHYAMYAYDRFKKPAEGAVKIEHVIFVVENGRDVLLAQKGFDRAENIMHGVTLGRNLVNTPAEHMHPDELVATARSIARRSKGAIKVRVLDREQCEKRGMGAYLAVAKGSAFPPQFIHLEYTPKTKARKTLAVVGKGITFDSGGLSLKPADGMMTMKCDMGGAATVLGLFSVLADLTPRVHIHGIIAACENMPSGTAMRPGDIVTAMNGKTIEILNTDAEGRLTLADALSYAVELKSNAIVDLATLTGACVVALGEEITGAMGTDDTLMDAILASAERSGEKMWEMPLPARYRSLIESDVADLRNIATSRYGGSLTAGLFLREFVDNTPWIHLDIAGPAFAEKPLASYIGKGGTGHGVRTLVELLEHLK